MAMTITTERLDELEAAARRDPAGHNYYGGCVWCRADHADFLNGGAHETALSLIAEIRRLQSENEDLRDAPAHVEDKLIDRILAKRPVR